MTSYMHDFVAFGIPGTWEWLIVLVVALLIFGRRLPDIARNIGKSLTEFKKGINEAKDTRDDLLSDVDEVKKDVAKEVKDAAGLDNLDKDN